MKNSPSITTWSVSETRRLFVIVEHLYAVDSLERDQRYNNDNDINIVDDVDDEQFRCYDTSLSKSVND